MWMETGRKEINFSFTLTPKGHCLEKSHFKR
jgi:hypothetical protein